MAELIHEQSGDVKWEGDDPLDLYDVLADFEPDEAGEYVIVGFDHTELPDKPPGEHRED